MSKKYYAVRKGITPGIYESWGEAESQVKGYSGAEYKSFKSLEEADMYMAQERSEKGASTVSTAEINQKIDDEISRIDDDTVLAFVDGSFTPKAQDGKSKYSFGVILLTSDAENKLYKSFVDAEGLESRNVSGEIYGAQAAIMWAMEQKKKRIKIFYDYEGIEKWAKGEWKASRPITQRYVQFIKDSKEKISMEFQHTPGHNGIKYNEQADKLAKAALDNKSYRTANDGSIYVVGITIDRWKEILSDLDNQYSNEINYNITDVKESHKRISIFFKDEKVTINQYHDLNSYIQGKSSTDLFSKIMNAVVIDDIDSEEKVVEVLNVYHALTVTVDEVEGKLKRLMPHFPKTTVDIKHKNMVLAAVYNTLLTGYMPDYTQLLHPAFRSMEYYLHKILKDKEGKQTTSTNSYGKKSNNFSFFSYDEASKGYRYNSNNSLEEKQVDYLNRLYNKYNQIRHPYSHTPYLEMDVRVVTSMTEARELILDCLRLFNEYYILF